MKILYECDIENTVTALEQAIENKKIQMRHVNAHAGASYGQISLALEQSGEFVQDFIKKMQQNVEERPWDALRKVAVSSFGIGLFLSLRHRKPLTEGKE